MENSTSDNIDLLTHIITKILEMIHSKNYTKKTSEMQRYMDILKLP